MIAYLLPSMHIYLLSSINPTKGAMDKMCHILVKDLPSGTGRERRKHLVAWYIMCLCRIEVGVGSIFINKITKKSLRKLLWRFRVATNSL